MLHLNLINTRLDHPNNPNRATCLHHMVNMQVIFKANIIRAEIILDNSRLRILPVEKAIGAGYASLVLPLVCMSLGCQSWGLFMLYRRHDSELIFYLRIYPWLCKFFEVNDFYFLCFWFFFVLGSQSAWSSLGATLKPPILLRVRYNTCRTKTMSMQSLVMKLKLWGDGCLDRETIVLYIVFALPDFSKTSIT